jgi:hypothetical protein
MPVQYALLEGHTTLLTRICEVPSCRLIPSVMLRDFNQSVQVNAGIAHAKEFRAELMKLTFYFPIAETFGC